LKDQMQSDTDNDIHKLKAV